MIGLVYATRAEADPFLKMAKARAVQGKPFELFEIIVQGISETMVVVSGMGKVPAALATQMLIRDNPLKLVVNAGICGSLTDRPGVKPGAVFRVDSVSGGESVHGIPEVSAECCTGMFVELEGTTLVTFDRPVFDSQERLALSRRGELVDMEGYSVAHVAGMNGVSCAIIKGVTDLAGEGDRRMLRLNLAPVAEKVAGLVWHEIVRLMEVRR
ncbi:MAG: hypothetical protein P1S46_00535 [bacterium]|nr:hypothetical protein [bacterium]MDT8396270.1 hypothetical protein [bacterium]